MIVLLVDTSIWIAHFARANTYLVEELRGERVLSHPCVVGELALSAMPKRAQIVELMKRLPQSRVASDSEVLAFIENLSLHGRGVGWVDAHLLASAALSGCVLWTGDRRLRAAAIHARIALN